MLLARLGMLGLLGVAACTIPNETHCGNQQGDATCSERFGAPMYCDVCVATNDGCVDAIPDAACRFGEPGPAEATSTASTSTSIDPSTTTSTPTGTTTPLSASGGEASTADAPATTDDADDSTGVDTTDASTGEATDGSETAATTDPSMSTGTACTPALQPCNDDDECCEGLVCGDVTGTCGVA